MRINRDSLSARAGSIAKEKGVSANVVYSRYFFDCFLKRLSLSPYSERFVLKGGLFLSSVLGIENRATMDIDFIVRRIRMERLCRWRERYACVYCNSGLGSGTHPLHYHGQQRRNIHI